MCPVYYPENYVQTAGITLATDFSTTSATFTTILTISGQTFGGSLNIYASTSSSNATNLAQVYFRLLLDGVSIGASSCKGDGGLASTSTIQGNNIFANSGALAAGSHTLNLQCRTSAGTLDIRPVSQPDIEYASLFISEVYV